MATESMSDRREHLRAVGVTAVTALLGIGTGLLSYVITGEPTMEEAAKTAAGDQRVYMIVVATIVGQLVVHKTTGLYDADEFGAKHVLFVALLTFCFWFVTFGILLSSVL